MAKTEMSESVSVKVFDVAVQIRNFEIELFWKRSLFFWGFIASAFVGYATVRASDSAQLSLVVACFGLVCSVAWTLVNRGSKYWQEAWEIKLEAAEQDFLGDFFARQEKRQSKGFWLSAREFSVSKIAIALSDYSVLVWAVVITGEVMRAYELPVLNTWDHWLPLGFASVSLLYIGAMIALGRKTAEKKR